MNDFSIQSVLQKAVQPKENRPKTSWWASDMGKCLSGAFYARQGIPQAPIDDRTLRVFSIGSHFEKWVIDNIKEAGWEGVEFSQPDTFRLTEFDLSVRPDLVCTFEGGGSKPWRNCEPCSKSRHDQCDRTCDCKHQDHKPRKIVYEIKTVHSKKFWWMEKKGEGADRHYLMQLWWGMKAVGADEGRLIYLSKDDLAIAEFPLFITDPDISKACLHDISVLNEAWKTQKAPTPQPDMINGKANWLATYCPFPKNCPHKIIEK
jgi:hypothetical protein